MPGTTRVGATGEADTWIAHAHGAHALERAIAVADAARVPLLPVKGILTARTLYDDVSERPVADVDVRVSPRDAARFVRAGVEAGWTLETWSRPYKNAVFDLDGTALDVEASLGPPGLCRLGVEDLLARSTPSVEPFGFRHRQPELHDHALLLAINAFKDKLVLASAHAVADLERVVLVPAFEPATLVARSREGAVTTLLWVVADWMVARGEPSGASWVEPWREIRRRIGPRPPRAAYAAALGRLLARPASLPARLAARLAADRPADRLRSIAVAAWWSADTSLRRALTARRPRAVTPP